MQKTPVVEQIYGSSPWRRGDEAAASGPMRLPASGAVRLPTAGADRVDDSKKAVYTLILSVSRNIVIFQPAWNNFRRSAAGLSGFFRLSNQPGLGRPGKTALRRLAAKTCAGDGGA